MFFRQRRALCSLSRQVNRSSLPNGIKIDDRENAEARALAETLLDEHEEKNDDERQRRQSGGVSLRRQLTHLTASNACRAERGDDSAGKQKTATGSQKPDDEQKNYGNDFNPAHSNFCLLLLHRMRTVKPTLPVLLGDVGLRLPPNVQRTFVTLRS